MTTYFYCAQAKSKGLVYSGTVEVDVKNLTADGYQQIRKSIIDSAVKGSDESGSVTKTSDWSITALNKI